MTKRWRRSPYSAASFSTESSLPGQGNGELVQPLVILALPDLVLIELLDRDVDVASVMITPVGRGASMIPKTAVAVRFA